VHILIIGGTRFLGRHIAERALSQGHRVTMFHRGRTLPDGLPGATSIVGDRSSDITSVAGSYDAIVDTCGYLPRDVAASCAHLRDATGAASYAFVSSVSAYRDGFPADADESTPLWDTGDFNATEMTLDTYGPLKALCERAVIDHFGGARALIVRPGLIVGPYDASDRFTYWIRRIGNGGTVLTPGLPNRRVQIVDARDIADWLVAMLEMQIGGTFNVTGPLNPLSFGELVRACAVAMETGAEFVWASQEFLLEHGVEPWTEMPLWIPEGEAGGWDTISSARAVASGLVYRPLRSTILETWRWDLQRDRQTPLKAGLSAEREAQLLDVLAPTVTS
jgi:2'-hydroxyisoflavone reductase